ncbi:hypothetical protein J6590_011812 [Homalodisca vitripennis]|nr:hypothetical protein J6590_011812 [Homalodisca vitripennis]
MTFVLPIGRGCAVLRSRHRLVVKELTDPVRNPMDTSQIYCLVGPSRQYDTVILIDTMRVILVTYPVRHRYSIELGKSFLTHDSL